MLQLSARAKLLGPLISQVGNFDLSTFPGRLTFQKTVYLLQAFGFYIGYRFTWYLYGPYSPELTRDGFDLAPVITGLPLVAFSSVESERRFREFLIFLDPIKADSKRLELVASLHFLRRVHPEWTNERIRRTLKEKQPYFDDLLIDEAEAR